VSLNLGAVHRASYMSFIRYVFYLVIYSPMMLYRIPGLLVEGVNQDGFLPIGTRKVHSQGKARVLPLTTANSMWKDRHDS
jgi:hypothetical protein